MKEVNGWISVRSGKPVAQDDLCFVCILNKGVESYAVAQLLGDKGWHAICSLGSSSSKNDIDLYPIKGVKYWRYITSPFPPK